MAEKLIFNCTHGKDDAERATLPLLAANVAAVAGQEAVMLCTVDAVWLGTPGGGDGIAADGLPVFNALYDEFVGRGGQVWLCGACTKPRGITEDRLRPGSIIVGAARVVEEVVNGARTVAFA